MKVNYGGGEFLNLYLYIKFNQLIYNQMEIARDKNNNHMQAVVIDLSLIHILNQFLHHSRNTHLTFAGTYTLLHARKLHLTFISMD